VPQLGLRLGQGRRPWPHARRRARYPAEPYRHRYHPAWWLSHRGGAQRRDAAIRPELGMRSNRVAGYLTGLGLGAIFGVVISAIMQVAKRGSQWERPDT